ncbi:MAG: acyl-CoA dehydratase activase [Candidatus Aenigmarchaeota archaeon]|nr:acyl-CoA dehydratase activase [Candidatus Aenigmarchaeota archaeon]
MTNKDIRAFDIGSSYLAIIECQNGAQKFHYLSHKGNYGDILKTFNAGPSDLFTGVNPGQYDSLHPYFALFHYAKGFEDIRHIVYVGASSFSIIHLNEKGDYLGHASNTTCASGTGAFLDLQAKRLGYSKDELGLMALKANIKPAISTRCSVFAKTDLIHLQQEGFTKEEIAAGLCYSLAQSIINTLFKWSSLSGRILLSGGVFQNPAVLSAFKEKFGEKNLVCENPQFALAAGLIAIAKTGLGKMPLNRSHSFPLDQERNSFKAEPLKPKSENYPDFDRLPRFIDRCENEIILYASISQGKIIPVYMGVDIGSTSTKLCLIDDGSKPILSIYRKTSSDPINAVKLLFGALREIEHENKAEFLFRGVATTGSGRKMIKAVIKADGEVNEITAHANAAFFIDPLVDTIIEIGGQDSKFTRLKNGLVSHVTMNYICAAGTGSFIEEQAEKLGIPIEEFSRIAEDQIPPLTSDRCTVFMEKDIEILISQGMPREEIAAGVMAAVRDNYLNKVVGNVPLGEHLYFQGATARNKALVAAFEQRMDKAITVSQFCHITGALGAALYIKEKGRELSNFVGLSFSERETVIQKEECLLCVNKCSLSVIKTDENKVCWGMKCGREYGEKRTKERATNPFLNYRAENIYQQKQKYKKGIIHIPDFLANSENLDFLYRFIAALDIEPAVIHPQKGDYQKGMKMARYEICAPCVAAFGAVSKAKGAPILMPYFLRKKIPAGLSHCHYCPLAQAVPSILKGLYKDNNFISPKVFEVMTLDERAEEFYNSLKDSYPLDKKAVKEALFFAYHGAHQSNLNKYQEGEKYLSLIKEDDLAAVILGRPYLVYNSRLNHDLINILEGYDLKAVPVDFMPPDPEFLRDKFPHMYWSYGQDILSSLKIIREKKNLFPVFLSCFSCGPDSFILNYFYKEMEALKKPYLTLQFDGHSAATGYLTRIEAAIDSFRNYLGRSERGDLSRHKYSHHSAPLVKDKKLLIPPMDPEVAELFAASLKGSGLAAEVLKESDRSYREGVKCSLGHECSPFHSTLGSLLSYLKSAGNGSYQYFMPSGTGPCRFGQYGILQDLVLKEMGYKTTIVSPSGENTYAGIPHKTRRMLFDAMLLNDILKKIIHKIRPYEANKGEAEKVFDGIFLLIKNAMENNRDYRPAFKDGLIRLNNIPLVNQRRPKIGIVGEIYVRNNPFLNDNLIKTIENLGGEAKISSFAEWAFYSAYTEKMEKKIYKRDGLMETIKLWLKNGYYKSREHLFYKEAQKYFDIFEPKIEDIIKAGSEYLPKEFLGEAILTVGRAAIFARQEKVDAIVNASPTFCMPGTLSSYILKEIENSYRVPVISLFYDKTGRPNMELVPYMELLRARSGCGGR